MTSPLKPLLLIVLCLLMNACVTEHTPLPAESDIVHIGDGVPTFSVVLHDGSTVSSQSLQGTPTVLTFFHTTCSDCQRELPMLQSLYETYAPSGVRFVCIARAEDDDAITTYWRENGLTLPFAAQADRSIYEKFAKAYIPRVYVISKAGIITAMFTETIDKDALCSAIAQTL